ncbi:MAG: ATP-binding protein [Nitrospirota bacterium]
MTLPVILLVCFTVGVALGLYVLAAVRAALVRDWGTALAGRAVSTAEALDRFLFERVGDIQLLAEHPALHAGTSAEQATALRLARDAYGYYAWIDLADATGRVRASTDSSRLDRDASQEAWFVAGRRSVPAPVVEGPSLAPGSGQPGTLSFSAPIRGPHGEIRGVVSSRISLDVLRRFLDQVSRLAAEAGHPYDWVLLDRQGTVITERTPQSGGPVNLLEEGLPSARLAAEARAGQSGFVEELHVRRRVPVVTGYARTHGYGRFLGLDWTVLARLDRAAVYAPIDRLIWRVGGIGLLVVAPLTGFGVWAVRWLVREERALHETSQALTASVRVSEERAAALQTLIETARTLTAEPNLERLLSQITEAARNLTGARYAALALPQSGDPRLPPFIVSGMDDATQRAIGGLPTGRGLLGALPPDGSVLRLTDLTHHPASVGFPPHHPPMRSFLGVVIRAHGQPFGQLYLTEKQGTEEFTETDAQVIAALAAQAGVVIENVRLLDEVRQAEAQHRAAQAQLANVLDHSPDLIIFTDREGRITRFNRGAEQVLGYAAAEVLGTPIADLYGDPQERQAVLAELEATGHVVGREVRLRAKDGRPVTISLTLSPHRDPEGRPLGTVGLSKDITAAKRLEAALRTSNAELESFVYAVSHDLQTPLRGIHGFAELLLKRTAGRLDERERHYLARIQSGSRRMANLINDLLEYSRIERITHPFEMVRMEQVVGQVRAELGESLQRHGAELRYEGTLPDVWGDRVRLAQVWQNLLTNAIKYVRPGEPPRITVGGRAEDGTATFWVRDQGIGIPSRFHDQIFQLFRRLHLPEQYEGTGIGLAIAKRIVDFHRGRIWVESVEGQGSTFFFTIPRVPEGGEPADRAQDDSSSSGP